MLIMRYTHRLPADHAMDRIRERAAARGPLWDDTPGLGFKVFSGRSSGGKLYAATYLWRDPAAALAFLGDERFQAVIDGFGRPRIETWMPWSVQLGRREAARSLRRETVPLGSGDLGALRRAEAEAARASIESGVAVGVLSGLDPATWQVTRFTLATTPAEGETEEILHLAAPGWAHFA